MAHFENIDITNSTTDNSNFESIFALGVGGFFIGTTQPFWRIQGIQQTLKRSKFARTEGLIKKNDFFSIKNFIQITKGSLYSGALPGVIEAMIFIGCGFQENKLKERGVIPKENCKPTRRNIMRYFLGTGAVAFISSLVYYPLTNIWIRLATDIEPIPKYSGFLDCIFTVLKEEGFSGFYVGVEYKILNDLVDAFFKTLKFGLNCYDKVNHEEIANKKMYYALDLIAETVRYPFEVTYCRKVFERYRDTVEIDGSFLDFYDGFLIQISQSFIPLGIELIKILFIR